MLLSQTKTTVTTCLLLCITGIIPIPFQKAQAQEKTGDKCWTVAASIGTVDEEDRDFINLGRRRPKFDLTPGGSEKESPSFKNSGIFGSQDAIVALTSNAPKGTYSVRYHISPEPGLFTGDQLALRVRYLVDDKKLGQVVVMFKKYNLESPPPGEIAEIIAVFDSKIHPASSEFQLHDISFNEDLDFSKNAYFVEALLINDREPTIPTVLGKIHGPALGAISLCAGKPIVK